MFISFRYYFFCKEDVLSRWRKDRIWSWQQGVFFWQGKKAENVVFLFMTSELSVFNCLRLLILPSSNNEINHVRYKLYNTCFMYNIERRKNTHKQLKPFSCFPFFPTPDPVSGLIRIKISFYFAGIRLFFICYEKHCYKKQLFLAHV